MTCSKYVWAYRTMIKNIPCTVCSMYLGTPKQNRKSPVKVNFDKDSSYSVMLLTVSVVILYKYCIHHSWKRTYKEKRKPFSYLKTGFGHFMMLNKISAKVFCKTKCEEIIHLSFESIYWWIPYSKDQNNLIISLWFKQLNPPLEPIILGLGTYFQTTK